MDQLSIYSNSYNKPLAYTKRPTRLEDFVGQDEAIKIIKKIIEKKRYTKYDNLWTTRLW